MPKGGGIDANERFSEVELMRMRSFIEAIANEGMELMPKGGGIDANERFSEVESMRMRSLVRWN